ncbi:MAG TPA: PHB depolymerase family esterase [Ktedonobacteraceae bacterium]|nr:PHB depolymerase family esterase [Ktedonobacteraceae bacterium]
MWQQYLYKGPDGSLPYYVYTPANYAVGTAVPLIVMLHGCTQTALDLAASTRMNRLADEYQFIVVYPQQVRANSSYFCWNWYEPTDQSRGSGEPALLAGIAQTVKQNSAQWTIDERRVYAAGISAGAAMSVILGATYPDIFAAIGVHSGLEYQAATAFKSVLKVSQQGGPDPRQQGLIAYNAMDSFARIVPTIVFQGLNDYIVHPINGDQVIQQWMRTDGLASNGMYEATFSSPATITSGKVPGGHTYTVYTWNDKHGSEVQEYWKVNGLGHAWSGGSEGFTYSDPQGPDASLAMYTFFMNHAK